MFVSVRYDGLHENVVPEDTRRKPGYSHYWLDVNAAYFQEHFRLIEDVAKPSD
jgi:hypothetical protein